MTDPDDLTSVYRAGYHAAADKLRDIKYSGMIRYAEGWEKMVEDRLAEIEERLSDDKDD